LFFEFRVEEKIAVGMLSPSELGNVQKAEKALKIAYVATQESQRDSASMVDAVRIVAGVLAMPQTDSFHTVLRSGFFSRTPILLTDAVLLTGFFFPSIRRHALASNIRDHVNKLVRSPSSASLGRPWRWSGSRKPHSPRIKRRRSPRSSTNALLASIPEGSKIVVSGRQNDKPFTEEGVLVKDKDGSYLLRRQRGIFVAFFGPNVTYDNITAKREQSVPPARRAQLIERQLEEEAEGDAVVRHRKPPQQRAPRYTDLDSDDDAHRPPPPLPPSTPPPTQTTALTEEGMMRIMRVMLAAQAPLRSTDALPPPPPPPPVSMFEDEDTRMARLFRAVGQGMQGEVKASWTLVPDALEIASQVDDSLRVFSVLCARRPSAWRMHKTAFSSTL
jgi:hypothetical protein